MWQGCVRRIVNEILRVKGLVHSAPEIVNGIEEKGKKFLKHSMLNETLLWILVATAMKTSVKLQYQIPFHVNKPKWSMIWINLILPSLNVESKI